MAKYVAAYICTMADGSSVGTAFHRGSKSECERAADGVTGATPMGPDKDKVKDIRFYVVPAREWDAVVAKTDRSKS